MIPVVVANALGYYEDAGLKVTIQEGTSATTGIQGVDSGNSTFAYVDAGKAALAVEKGAKIKTVAVYMQKNQGTVISRASAGINAPKDVIGKTVGTTTGSSSEAAFKAFLAASGISESQVKIQSVSSASKIATLLSGKVDAITGFLGSECVQVKLSLKEPVTCLEEANYGVHSLGEGIIASDSTLTDNESIVTAFLDATNRGWEYSLNSPEQAAQITNKAYPTTQVDLLVAQFNASKELLHTDSTKSCTLGYMSPQDWLDTLSFLKKFSGLGSEAAPDTYYQNILTCQD